MKDQSLRLCGNSNVDTGNTANVVDLTGFGGSITFISDAIPTSSVLAYGDERLALQVVCSSAFADSSNVTMELASYSAGDITSIGTAIILGGLSSHWISPVIPNTSFTAGRRMATVPLPPQRELQAHLFLTLKFSAETSGRINAYITPATTMLQSPPANAI